MIEIIGWIAFFIFIGMLYYFLWKFYKFEKEHSKL